MKKIFFIIFLMQTLFARILIQGAMDSEIDLLVSSLKDKKVEKIGNYKFYIGKIANQDIVVSKTLIGLSNAAAATALGIIYYKPSLVINQGTAGGHNLSLNVGDIVIGKKIYNAGAYYTDFSEDEPNYKNKLPMKAPLRLLDNKEIEYYTSDDIFVNMVSNFAKSINQPFIIGTIVSADAYNKESKLIEWINKTYNSDAEEMESISAAQISKAFDIPFLSIRIISNIEPKKLSFDETTAMKCQDFVIKFIKHSMQ